MTIKYICQEHGCKQDADIYHYPDDNVPSEWLCVEHATQEGFCYMCGHFWAGVEAYDFSPIEGVCPNCIDEFRHDDYDYDDVGYLDFDIYADNSDYYGVEIYVSE